MDDRVLDLRQWLNLLGGELDYDYGTTEQPNGTMLSYPLSYVGYTPNPVKILILTPSLRKLAHPTLSGESLRRMLKPQYPDLIPTVRVRLQDLGISGSEGVDIPDVHQGAEQAPQYGATSA